MKFLQATIGGCVPFKELQSVNIPNDRIVAVTGDNGAGKSTFLDVFYMAIYGDTTKPGGLYPLFNTKDGIVDVTLAYKGSEIRIKRMIDGIGRKQRVFVWRDGLCLTEGKSTQASAILADLINVPESVFLASVYNAQTQKGNPLEMRDGDRRDLLSQVVGLNAFQPPLDAVSQHLNELNIQYNEMGGQIGQLERVGTHSDPIVAEKKALQDSLPGLESSKQALVESVTKHQQRLADINATQADASEIESNYNRLTANIKADEAAILDFSTRKQNNETKLIARATEIRNAVARSGILKTEIEGARDKVAAAQKSRQNASEELSRARESLSPLQFSISTKQRDFSDTAARRDLINKYLSGATGKVPCNGVGEYAACPLLTGQQQQRAEYEAELPGVLAKIETITGEMEALKNEHEMASSLVTSRQNTLDVEALALSQAEAALLNLTNELASIQPLSDLAPQLEVADNAVEEYTRQIEQLNQKVMADREELGRWAAKRDALADHAKTTANINAEIQAANDGIRTIDEKIASTNTAIGRAEIQIKTINDNISEIRKLQEAQQTIAGDIADYKILKQGLGPKGAPALKIDASGPAISELANILLAECYGSRFTISIQTQKNLSSDATQVRECLEFTVIDHNTGEESPVDQKSGGEQQLIREVISIALCIYQRKQTGADLRTIIRDESCSALTEDNTIRYVDMLSKAAEIGEFDQVLFVSHKTATATMTDKNIVVANGKIVV